MGSALLAAAGCLTSAPSGRSASAPRIIVTEGPTAVTAALEPVWVLTPVGLNVRAEPDPQSQRVATLTQGAKLDVQQSRKFGTQTWLRVRSQSGQVDGWVLDDPDLVIHRAVSQHVESTAGYSNLFPATWTLKSGNPATMTSPPSDPEGGSLLIQSTDDVDKLLATPDSAGKELRQESPIEVYGKTTYLTVYQLDAGGYEFAVRVKFAKSAYLFLYKQSARPQADTSLFKTLLSSVIVPG